jgi:hypothetical protein
MKCQLFLVLFFALFLMGEGCGSNSEPGFEIESITRIIVRCQNWTQPHRVGYEKLMYYEGHEISSPQMLTKISKKLIALVEIPNDYQFESPWVVAQFVDTNGEATELKAAFDKLEFDGRQYYFDKKLVNLLLLWSDSDCDFVPGATNFIANRNDAGLFDFDPFDGDWNDTIP